MDTTPVNHRERLTASLPWWLTALLFGLIVGWLMWVATTPLIAAVSAAFTALGAGALVAAYGSVVVEAGPDGLRVGRAFLDAEHLGQVEVLEAESWQRAVGPEGDVRAFAVLRPYIRSGVRVQVDDPADPTPFWLVSARYPASVARGLGRTP